MRVKWTSTPHNSVTPHVPTPDPETGVFSDTQELHSGVRRGTVCKDRDVFPRGTVVDGAPESGPTTSSAPSRTRSTAGEGGWTGVPVVGCPPGRRHGRGVGVGCGTWGVGRKTWVLGLGCKTWGLRYGV